MPLPLLPLHTARRHHPRTKHINRITLIRPFRALLPLDADGALVEPHPPVIRLIARQTRTVDTALLASA